MAQGRIAVLQQEAILLGIGSSDLRLLGVRFHVAGDQCEDLFAVGEIRGLDIAPQAGPVLGFVIGRDDPFGEPVELLNVVLQGLRTSDCQIAVVRIGTLGRGVSLQPHARDGHVGVETHRINRRVDLAQLDRIAPVFGIDHRLVHGEVDERRSAQRTALDRLGGRTHEDDLGDVDRRFGIAAQSAVLFGQKRMAAAVVLAVEQQRRPVHPLGIGDDGAVSQIVGFQRSPVGHLAFPRKHARTVTYII